MGEKVSAAEFATARGIPESAVIHRIESGIYDGVEEDGVWYVLRNSPQETEPDKADSPPHSAPEREPQTKKVARYTSQAYVNSILILLGVLIASDLVLFALQPDGEPLQGLGPRLLVIILLWTQSKWARLAVKVWSGLLVVIGAFGLFTLRSLDPAEHAPPAWGPMLFLLFIVIGLGYFLTVNRFIKVEEVPA